jgi:hypothetical protein
LAPRSTCYTPPNRITKSALRKAIHNQFMRLGFAKNGTGYFIHGELTKQRVRDFHSAHRAERLREQRSFVQENGSCLIEEFANGEEIDPTAIEPELIQITSRSYESDLFRFATLLWSVPVSQGFGRRIRFIVRDKQNGKLMGLFALGDPVFNLSARDNWIGWTSKDRSDRLIHVMDAYVVGAVPPYANLLCGKLIASLMTSSEVIKAHEQKYSGQESEITGAVKRARLVLITTTSALGRSSLYNRLSLPGGLRFHNIGTTKGFGHFHLSGRLFEMMRRYLEERNHPYARGHRFGMGPNWRLRVARVALTDIGSDADSLLRHKIHREVYCVPLAENWKEVLLGKQTRIRTRVPTTREITDYCLARWIVPRSIRDNRFRQASRGSILHCLLNGGPPPSW